MTPGRSLRQLGPILIITATVVVIGLAWFGALSAIAAHRTASRARVETEVQSKADLVAEQLHRELLVTDQSLHILELEWQRDPATFDFASWRKRVLALTDMSLQIFTADAAGIVRRSSRPEIIGDYVGERDYFRHEAALTSDDERMFIGSLIRGLVTQRWQINLARRLDLPQGGFGGVIVASYDVSALHRLQMEANLGRQGLLIVTTSDGALRGVGDESLARPDLSIARSPVFFAMRQSQSGRWVGRSPLDGIDRIMAFADIAGRGLRVLVGLDRAEAMRTANEWEQQALLFTMIATVFVLLMAGVMLWAERAARLRHAAAIRDRTVLANANAQLEATEQRERTKATQLEATLAGMTDGIMMVDANLQLLAWNARFPEFTGVPAEILRVGLPMEHMLRAQALAGEFGIVTTEAEVIRRLALLRRGASIGTIERRRPSGRTLEIRRNPLPGGGFVTLYSDITGRRNAEDRARRAETMAAIGRLTSGIAHDFNNMLSSISGNAEMLYSDFAGAPREARRLSIILQAANRGADLTRQLLAFARKQTLAPKLVDLNAVVRGIGELLNTTLGPKITSDFQLAPDLWAALVDPVQIEHVVLNLAINARDAMPDGGQLTITTNNVSLTRIDNLEDLPQGDYVVVVVQDTGTGMTDEVLRNAFEPFFTTKPPGSGSGLGLSQVYGVSQQSGGGARIDSKLGQGTTVSVFLPRALNQAAVQGEPDAPSGQPVRRAQSHPPIATVLVVDDEADVRTTIAAMVEAGGFAAVGATSGNAALALIRDGLRFDLLLVDFAMPDMTGVELARAVRERRADVPIVLVTGHGEEEPIEEARWILRKPFSVATLTNMLQQALTCDCDSGVASAVGGG
ncbi:MAG TPA: PAS-domain containing protein [Acetobacteraceae bacterium]|nr:PAS-domain containing protein [Acetobacteraceae bacterium]